MNKKLTLLISLLFAAPFLHAQEKLNSNLFLKKLANGLDVLVVEDHSVPLTTIAMTFKAGPFTETNEISGLTGLYEIMLSKGNKDFANEMDYNYYSGQLGIKLQNFITNEEYATSYFTLPSSNFKEGLTFMNSTVRFPNIKQEALNNVKQTTDNSLKQKESDPYFILNSAVNEHLWGDQYSRKKPLGNRDVKAAATPELLRMIKNRYYYPNNALLIIGGDITHELAFSEAEKNFASWARSDFDPFKNWPVPEFKPLTKSELFMVPSALSTVPAISFNWQGPDTRNDITSTYAADVFSYIINQNASKLNQALVQSGLASSMQIGYLTQKYVGPITLTVNPNPGKVKECIDVIKQQIALMDNDDYLTPDKIETAKRILEIREIRKEDITTTYIQSLSFWWASASLNYLLGYEASLKKVTQADIKNYVRKYIKGKPYCAGILINPDLAARLNVNDLLKPAN